MTADLIDGKSWNNEDDMLRDAIANARARPLTTTYIEGIDFEAVQRIRRRLAELNGGARPWNIQVKLKGSPPPEKPAA